MYRVTMVKPQIMALSFIISKAVANRINLIVKYIIYVYIYIGKVLILELKH